MLTLYCLGNPTVKHKNNRHNAGLLLGEFLVDKLELKLKKFKNFKNILIKHADHSLSDKESLITLSKFI